MVWKSRFVRISPKYTEAVLTSLGKYGGNLGFFDNYNTWFSYDDHEIDLLLRADHNEI